MNVEQQTLVKRLTEAGLTTRRFLKLDAEKKAFEKGWPNRLYIPEELDLLCNCQICRNKQAHPYWGICGKDGLVLVDADEVLMENILRQVLAETFEVKSPRRGLVHLYFVVEGNPVENKTLFLKGEEDGAGEVRAQNYYLVAPGTEIHYRDLRTSEPRTGRYIITQDRPFAKVRYEDFMDAIKPYLGKNEKQPITFEQMRTGVPQGTRHAQGIKYANFLIGVQKFDYATALNEMLRWNQLCQPSMDEADLERMVKNAIEYVAKNSREKENHDPQLTPKAKKQKKTLKDSGLSPSGCFEAIYHRGEPRFLVENGGSFSIIGSLTLNGEELTPKDVKHIPYEPYGWFEGTVPNREALFGMVRREIDSFVDVEPIWKDVLAATVLLSYQQEKLLTVPYILLYGDNESGKSTVLQVLKFLCYRPMYGVTIPAADIYGYLEDSDGIGCILEDEVQGIHKDIDKTKIYKAGYKKGAVVPRTILTNNDRIIKYYRTFCFKTCASEQIPKVKGFNERFLFIPMVEGYPEKEWADITKEDLERVHNLRNCLLKWRMLSRDWELPSVELNVKGRLKELWKPILQITHSLTVYDALFKFVADQRKERLSSKQDTLEGKVVKVATEIFNKTMEEPNSYTFTIPFSTIWTLLREELDGKIDEKKPHVMDTSEFFQVTKNKVGYRLREVLSGKTRVLREKVGDEWVSTKAYEFNMDKLRRIAKKYGYELVTKLHTLPSSEGVKASESMEKDHTNNVEKASDTPLKLGKVNNSVTNVELENVSLKVLKLERLHDNWQDKCVVCGFQGRMDWQVTEHNGSWGLLCGGCGQKLSERLSVEAVSTG
jgi:hypothetical protein